MLLLALGAREELNILGVTAVGGNVPLASTERNARMICELAGHSDVAVYAGCPGPMVRRLVTAEHVHGRSGIDGIEMFEPARAVQAQHGVTFLVETLRAAAENSVTLVATGPLTNVAMAFALDPAVVTKVREIVIMGGAMREGGNATPSAEFNVLVDPHAAHVVLHCARPIVVMGLDVTHQVLATRARIERLRALGTRPALAACGLLEFFGRHDSAKYGFDGAPLHDPCTVAYLLQPALFEARHCNIEVETGSELTLGHTAVDFWGVSDRPRNARWVHKVDADGFYDLLTERIARL